MKSRLLTGLILSVLITVFLTGCGTSAKEPRELYQVELERGNASVWGSQFHILVSEEEILWVSMFQGTGTQREYTTEYNIPISPEDWQAIEAQILLLEPELKVKRNNPLRKLMPQIEGGTEYHSLKLTVQVGEKRKETEYIWTDSLQQRELEALLEDLANTHQNG